MALDEVAAETTESCETGEVSEAYHLNLRGRS